MIRSILFDLDGTLVQTETLKAESYALAAQELCPYTIIKEDVLQAYQSMLGSPRDRVAQDLVRRFDLQDVAEKRMQELGVRTPWQAFIQIRLRYYERLVGDPEVIRQNKCPHALGLLDWGLARGYRIGVATMSHCPQASRILDLLAPELSLDILITRDDVDRGKPDPEIYLSAARQLDMSPQECLVIEDSATGIRAALAAGMTCLAVPSSFTAPEVERSGLLPQANLAASPEMLQQTAEQLLDQGS